MSQVSLSGPRPNLDSAHPMSNVFDFHNFVRIDWLKEAGPARPAIEFGFRGKKGLAGNYVYVNAGFFMVPVFVVEGWFGAALTGNVVLRFGKACSEFFVGFRRHQIRIYRLRLAKARR